MKYVWQFGLGLVLIVTQTTILPYFKIFDSIYDLLCPLVIYIGLFQPVRKAVPVILLYGFLMDNLSGAPPGFYLTTYIWLFVYAVVLCRFMHVNDKFIGPLIVALGVVIENCLNLGVIAILTPAWQFSFTIVWQIVWQVVWAIVATPFLFALLNRVHAHKPVD
jgi:cell shape-determining protein MreD